MLLAVFLFKAGFTGDTAHHSFPFLWPAALASAGLVFLVMMLITQVSFLLSAAVACSQLFFQVLMPRALFLDLILAVAGAQLVFLVTTSW